MKVEDEDLKEFAVGVGIYQGSVLSLFIFAVVMHVVTGGSKRGTCPGVCRFVRQKRKLD